MNKTIFNKTILAIGSALLCSPAFLTATPLSLSDTPLAVSTTVEPNVMLLIDNSGSMANIVWDIERNVTKPDATVVKRSTITAAPAIYSNTTTYNDWGFGTSGNIILNNIDNGGTPCSAGWTRGTNGSGTKHCIKLPDPNGGKNTRYTSNYLNYIFDSYPDGTDLTDTATYYWFPSMTRIQTIKSSTTSLVTTVPNVRFGLAKFDFSAGGYIDAACGSSVSTLTTKISNLGPDTWTPLAETYYEITRYFRGLKGYQQHTGSYYDSPVQYRCQQNFVVVLTDGLPTYDNNIPSNPTKDPDVTSGCDSSDGLSSTPPCLPNWDELAPATVLGDSPNFPQFSDGFNPYSSSSTEGHALFLDDLAKFAYEIDLRSDPKKSGANTSDTGKDNAGVSFDDLSANGIFKKQNLRTYTIGFAIDSQFLEDSAYYGQDPLLDASGNTQPGVGYPILKKKGYYTANDTQELASAFNEILAGVQQTTGSAAAVAASTGFISKETLLFQAIYDTNNWEGRLKAFQLDPTTRQLVVDGSGNPKVLWEAGDKLTNKTYTNRFIMTYGKKGGAGNPLGYQFNWANFPAAVKTDLTYVDSAAPLVTTDDKYIYEYILGDRSKEELTSSGAVRTVAAGGIFRPRGKLVTIDVPDPLNPGKTKKKVVTYNSNLLGDIVNSSPVYIGRPNMPYNNHWNESFEYLEPGKTKTTTFTQTAPENAVSAEKYSDFRKHYSGLGTTGYDRNKYAMLYVGANDGMLHGFDATTTTTGGDEKFAFIPSPVIKNLKGYSEDTYTHKYFADGAPNVIDAFYTATSESSADWHTTLAAGLNNGGQGIYVLNVTDPKNSFAKSDADAAKLVQWEFTDKDDPDLGYTYSQPAIVRMANGRWAAVFGNGYNNTADNDGDGAANDSTSGDAVLYIVFLDGPGADGVWDKGIDYIKIDTGVGLKDDIDNPTNPNYDNGACAPGGVATGGTGPIDLTQSKPNGMSTVTATDTNGDFIADFIYAGDLYGNMWKFDVRSNDPTKWGSLITSASSAPLPLYKARTGACPQPITSQPAVIAAKGSSMVLFGTGKFIETTDNDTNNALSNRIQTFYGLLDTTENDKTPLTHVDKTDTSWLQQKVITGEEYGVNRSFTNAQTGDIHKEDTRTTSNNGTNNGSFQSWYMDLPVTGERVVYEPFVRGIINPKVVFVTAIPTNDVCVAGGSSWLMELDARDGSRTKNAVFDLNYDGKLDAADNSGGGTNVLNGWKLPGIATAPTVIATDTVDIKVMSTSTGSLELKQEGPPDQDGRQSWRQIK